MFKISSEDIDTSPMKTQYLQMLYKGIKTCSQSFATYILVILTFNTLSLCVYKIFQFKDTQKTGMCGIMFILALVLNCSVFPVLGFHSASFVLKHLSCLTHIAVYKTVAVLSQI